MYNISLSLSLYIYICTYMFAYTCAYIYIYIYAYVSLYIYPYIERERVNGKGCCAFDSGAVIGARLYRRCQVLSVGLIPTLPELSTYQSTGTRT